MRNISWKWDCDSELYSPIMIFDSHVASSFDQQRRRRRRMTNCTGHLISVYNLMNESVGGSAERFGPQGHSRPSIEHFRRWCRKGLSIVIIQFRCLWRGIVYLGSMRNVSGFPLNCIRLSFYPLDIKYLTSWVVKSLLLDDEVFWDSLLIRGSFSHKIKKRVQREKFQFFETSSFD